MVFRLFFMLLALNLLTLMNPLYAEEVTEAMDQEWAQQIGENRVNQSVAVSGGTSRGDCLKRALGMIGNRWLKDMMGMEVHHVSGDNITLSRVLSESDYSLRMNGEDVVVKMTYSF